MSNHIENLQKIGKIFTNDNNDFLEHTEAINQYKSIVHELSSLDNNNENNKQDLYFNNGKAIGTTWAAMCLNDILRTKIFIKSIFKAIASLQKKGKKPIHILYAGTGPFATLLLPILATYSPQKVKVTLVEINKESFNNMQQIIKKLGFDGHVVNYENKDATTLKISSKLPIDIIVSETLQCGLVREQQVPITINLLNQVPQNTILIPEMVALDVCLINYNAFENKTLETIESDYCIVLDRLIEINNKSNDELHYSLNDTTTQVLAEKEITIYPEMVKLYETLMLTTRITVFENEMIQFNESGLTTPIYLDRFSDLKEKKTFKIAYKVDAEPGYIIHY
ncbi:hypothetical protein FIA58_003490 [Flavobacterium jejuense]|uniref:PRMT5 arginine-N-methyltransferase domain-containing protein n=1 Tax=Flavobacterium jejuense TaxID=1544455 RepID=A0ABX0INU8_9FLAO|nr:hypothetical protein [Flavobacterium jejuense]NHN24730.1 hypothetical protein [Flavobacterium jejuense]